MEDLKLWLEGEKGRGVRLAKHLHVPPSFVSKMASGDRPIPTEHGAPIETFTERAVTRQKMFPLDWRRIWPELAELEDDGRVVHVVSVGGSADPVYHHEGAAQ